MLCWGPSTITSHCGVRYFLSFIDDIFKIVWIYIIKNKSNTLEKFKELKTLVKNLIRRKIKRLKTDNGLKYLSNELSVLCKREEIAGHNIVSETLQ